MMISQIPQNWWQQNQFMMPQLQEQGFRPPPGLIDLAPKTDQTGILSTSGMQMPDYTGSGGGKGGNTGGPDLSRGAAQYGQQAGANATADTTTTATTDWSDFAKALAVGAIPGIGALMATTGLTEQAKQALGLTPTPQQATLAPTNPAYGTDPYGGGGQGTASAPNTNNPGVDLIGQANDPFGGGSGLGQGSSDIGQGTGTDSGEGGPPGGWAKGGPVMTHMLAGPNPPGPDEGVGGLMGGEFVVNAKAAKKHRGLLDAINSGASKAKIKGLLG